MAVTRMKRVLADYTAQRDLELGRLWNLLRQQWANGRNMIATRLPLQLSWREREKGVQTLGLRTYDYMNAPTINTAMKWKPFQRKRDQPR